MERPLAHNPDRPRAIPGEWARHGGRGPWDAGYAAWTTLAVLAGMALALRAGDAISGWVRGVPRGVHLCTSVAEAEARTGLSLGQFGQGLPGYAFTTGGIRTTTSPVRAVAVQARAGQDQVTLLRSSDGEIPLVLRPPLPAFHELTIPLAAGRTATLRAARQADGSVWQDLEWPDGVGKIALRGNGRTVELIRLAKQVSEELR